MVDMGGPDTRLVATAGEGNRQRMEALKLGMDFGNNVVANYYRAKINKREQEKHDWEQEDRTRAGQLDVTEALAKVGMSAVDEKGQPRKMTAADMRVLQSGAVRDMVVAEQVKSDTILANAIDMMLRGNATGGTAPTVQVPMSGLAGRILGFVQQNGVPVFGAPALGQPSGLLGNGVGQ